MDDLDGVPSREDTDFFSLAEHFGLKLYVAVTKAHMGIDDKIETQASSGALAFSRSLFRPPGTTERTSMSSRGSSTPCLPEHQSCQKCGI